jgi:capsular exopolysaccharide synthesis family protein
VLGHIPLEKFDKGEKRRLTIVQHPGSPAAESYRVLRNALEFVDFEHDIKVLLVASSAPGEGKSTVAANLAAALAQTGKKVVLVNADFRRPATEEFFPVSNLVGLSDVLAGRNSLKSALQRPGDEQLLLLAGGQMPPNPSELLGSQKMADIVESLKEWGDWIIIDSPPLLAVADAAAIARWVDGVIMVTRGGISTRDAARKGRETLDRVGARVVGVAVWGLEESGGGGGYGSYHDYYGGYYGRYTSGGTGDKKRRGDSGAKGGPSSIESQGAQISMPEKSTGRRAAETIGRVMAGLLAFVVVLAIVSVVVYLLDGYFGWGLVPQVTRMLGLG